MILVKNEIGFVNIIYKQIAYRLILFSLGYHSNIKVISLWHQNCLLILIYFENFILLGSKQI